MRNYADNSVDSVGNRAKLSGPETATGPVLSTPTPPELNQRGIATVEMRPPYSAHFGSGTPRTQGVCLVTEPLQETRAPIDRPRRVKRFSSDAEMMRHYEKQRRRKLRDAQRLGRHTPEQWNALLTFCGHRCLACGSPPIIGKVYIVRDHIQPITDGGSDAIDNLQPLCRDCNSRKGARDWGDLRPDGWRGSQP